MHNIGFDLPPAPGPAGRQPMRDPIRGEIRGRNGEVLVRRNRSGETADGFEVPAQLREDGWDLQWVRASTLGKDDRANVNAHYENGWRPVPSERMDGFYHERGYTGAIERDGLILMERPAELTLQAVHDGIRAARLQRQNQSADFHGVDKIIDDAGGHGIYEAANAKNDARSVATPRLKRTIEAAPETSYPKRTLAVGAED